MHNRCSSKVETGICPARRPLASPRGAEGFHTLWVIPKRKVLLPHMTIHPRHNKRCNTVSNPSVGCASKRRLWKARRSLTKGVPVEPLKGKNKSQKEKRSTRSKHSIFGLAFDRNRVLDGLGDTSDGSAGRPVGCRRQLGCSRGVRCFAARLRCCEWI